MIKKAVRRALLKGARISVGQRLAYSLILADPELAREPLAKHLNRRATFSNVAVWPERLAHFEDTSFLFASNTLNHGIISLAFDEAAYLYRLVASLPAAALAEIGRFRGGSTLLMAAATDERSELWSYDSHVKIVGVYSGGELDEQLRQALERYGLADRVHLVVADSRTAEPPARPCDLVFLDGDHSYAGVRADYEHWRRFVKPGGHLVLHDAVEVAGRLDGPLEGVPQLVRDIEQADGAYWSRRPAAGSLAHFIRTEAPDDWP